MGFQDVRRGQLAGGGQAGDGERDGGEFRQRWRLLFIVDGLIWFIPVPEFKNAHSLTIKWAMHWPNLTINCDDLATAVNSNLGTIAHDQPCGGFQAIFNMLEGAGVKAKGDPKEKAHYFFQ